MIEIPVNDGMTPNENEIPSVMSYIDMNKPIALTDTDFESLNRNLSKDLFNLLYGSFLLSSKEPNVEGVYNLLVHLSNEYLEPILRKYKLKEWIKEVDQLISEIQEKKKSQDCHIVVMPFFVVEEHTLEEYERTLFIAKDILQTIQEEESVETLQIHHGTTGVKYPIDDLEQCFIDFSESYDEHIYGHELQNAIAAEGINRGFETFLNGAVEGNDNIDLEQGLYVYKNYILRNYYRNKEDDKDFRDWELIKEDRSNGPKLDAKRRTAVLWRMLQSFGVTDQEQARKLIEYVLFPNKEYSSKASSNNTIYNYLHNKNQLISVDFYTIETLWKYKIDIPKELKSTEEMYCKRCKTKKE